MELKNFLIEAVKERFKAHSTVLAIERRIRVIAEEKTFKMYKGETLLKYGMEFELVGVRASFRTYELDIKIGEIDLILAFLCKSKLPKKKKEKLLQVKSEYLKEGYLPYNIYKTPIWEELHYSVKLENVLSGNFRLDINSDN